MLWLIPISIHKALAGLDAISVYSLYPFGISIHKALAGLDIYGSSK